MIFESCGLCDKGAEDMNDLELDTGVCNDCVGVSEQ